MMLFRQITGRMRTALALLIACTGLMSSAQQKIPVNYDESKVGKYTLPDPLVLENGQPIRHDIGFHCHAGKHEVLPFDWDQFLHFCSEKSFSHTAELFGIGSLRKGEIRSLAGVVL